MVVIDNKLGPLEANKNITFACTPFKDYPADWVEIFVASVEIDSRYVCEILKQYKGNCNFDNKKMKVFSNIVTHSIFVLQGRNKN